MSVAPFPWGALDATSREEIAALAALRRWGAANVRPEAFAAAARTLLDVRIEVLVRRAEPLDRPRPIENGVAVVIARADAAKVSRGALVEVEAPLAAKLVARAMRREAPAILDPSQPPAPAIAGAFGAVVVAAARRAHANAPLRVLASGPSSALVADVARAEPTMLVADLTVIVDDDAYLARVMIPRALAMTAPPPAWSLRGLGDVKLRVAIVACARASTAAEIASLRPGDVWLPGEWPLTRGELGLVGPVLLAPPTCEHAIVADLGEGERLVLRGSVEPLAWTPEPKGEAMTETNDTDALVEAVGEVPVVVRVEIGVAEMRAREWASLAKGDVVALGRRIGDPVALRVGGLLVARGELVDVDGDVGVRVGELIEAKENRT